MKKLLVFLSLIFVGYDGLSQKGQQILGVQLGGMVTTSGVFGDQAKYKPQFASLSGIFYDANLTRRVGLNVEVNYRYSAEERESHCGSCLGKGIVPAIYIPVNFTDFSYLDVPVNLAINLNWKETNDLKTYFTLGYTYSRLMHFNITYPEQEIHRHPEREEFKLDRNYHYLNTGLEFRYQIKGNYMLSFLPNLRFLIDNNTDKGYLGFNLKLGRIL